MRAVWVCFQSESGLHRRCLVRLRLFWVRRDRRRSFISDGGMCTMKKVVTFGEIMMRLSPPGFLRFPAGALVRRDLRRRRGQRGRVVGRLRRAGGFRHAPAQERAGRGLHALYARSRAWAWTSIVCGGERLGIYFLENGRRAARQQGRLRPRQLVHRHHRAAAWWIGRPSLPTRSGSTGPASPRPSPRARPRPAWRRSRWPRRWA